MKTPDPPAVRRRRAASGIGLVVALGVAIVATIVALAVPALAASPGRSLAATACGSLVATSSGTGSDLTGQPSDGLDAVRQCGGSPTGAQARYEAILAGVGVVGFAGATLVYRRRHQHPPAAHA